MSESIPPGDPISSSGPLPEDDIPLSPSDGPASPPLPPITPLPTTAPEAVVEMLPANKDEQNMGLLVRLLGIFTGFLGPLVIWLIKREDSKYIEEQSKEELNFQIAALIVIFSCLILLHIPFLGLCVFLPLSLAVHVTRIVFGIIATMAASKGEIYRYPLTLRLIS